MVELFPNISQHIKDYAEFIWERASELSPDKASDLLNNTTNTFDKEGLEEEADFLRFYFNLQMEMMKK